MTKKELEKENESLREEVKFLREQLGKVLAPSPFAPFVYPVYVTPVTPIFPSVPTFPNAPDPFAPFNPYPPIVYDNSTIPKEIS